MTIDKMNKILDLRLLRFAQRLDIQMAQLRMQQTIDQLYDQILEELNTDKIIGG